MDTYSAGDICIVRARAIAGGGAAVCGVVGGGGSVGGAGGAGSAGGAAAGAFVVFARGLIPGELARVVLTNVSKSYAKADLLEVLEASPERQTPECPHFGTCGGCDLMHMPYASELVYKKRVVEDAFVRIGGFSNVRVGPVIGDWDADRAGFRRRYRNKGQYAFFDPYMPGARGRFGFFQAGAHDAAPVGDCLLQKGANAQILQDIADWVNKNAAAALDENGAAAKGTSGRQYRLRDVVVRTGEATGDVMIELNYSAAPDQTHRAAQGRGRRAAKAAAAPAQYAFKPRIFSGLAEILKKRVSALRSVILNVSSGGARSAYTLYGDGFIEERLGSYTFRVSGGAFFQVNSVAAERLFKTVADLSGAGPGDRALELYCGTGALTMFLAGRVKRVTGVEASGAAVADARINARRNGFTNARFTEGRAEEAAAELAGRGERYSLVVLDPPRSGCGAPALTAISSLGADRIVYASCDQATLGRDAARLRANGYILSEVRPIDMFPRSANVEIAALFVKQRVGVLSGVAF